MNSRNLFFIFRKCRKSSENTIRSSCNCFEWHTCIVMQYCLVAKPMTKCLGDSKHFIFWAIPVLRTLHSEIFFCNFGGLFLERSMIILNPSSYPWSMCRTPISFLTWMAEIYMAMRLELGPALGWSRFTFWWNLTCLQWLKYLMWFNAFM